MERGHFGTPFTPFTGVKDEKLIGLRSSSTSRTQRNTFLAQRWLSVD